MADFDNLKWTLIAEDKASGTFKQVAVEMKNLTDVSEKMQSSVSKGSSSWVDMAKGMVAGTFAADSAKKAFRFLKDQLVDTIGQAEEYERVQAQLQATLASTEGAAGLTLNQLNEMADGMANMAVGGSEAINALQGTLLTFTNIGSDMFGTVTQSALDLATSLNHGVLPSTEDLNGAAIMLGKAFQDPISGMTSLSRVGALNRDDFERLNKEWSGGTVPLLQQQQELAAALAKEYEGSAAAATQTLQGRMVALNNALDDGKKIIGQALLPTLSLFVSGVTDATGKIKVNQDTMYTWQLRVYQVAVIIKGAILTVGNFGKGIYYLGRVVYDAVGVMMGVFGDLGTAMAQLGKNFNTLFTAVSQGLSGDFSGALDTLSSGFKSVFKQTSAGLGALGDSFGGLVSTLTGGMDPMNAAIKEAANHTAFDALIQSMKDAEEAANSLGANGGGSLENFGSGSSDALKKVQDEVQKVSDSYQSAQEDIAQELFKLEQSHEDSVNKIVDKLKSLQTTMDETTQKYQQSMSDLNKTEAEKVVDQEQKIADLKKQIATESAQASADQIQAAQDLSEKEAQLNVLYEKRNELTGNEKQSSVDSLNNQIAQLEQTISEAQSSSGGNTRLADLQTELAKEQAAYDDYIANTKLSDADLTEARRRASETEFQRYVEDINARRQEEQDAYNAKILEIQTEVLEQQKALDEENAVYDAKKAMYAEVSAAFQKFHDDYLANLDSMKSYTSESVAVMAQELDRISKLFQEVKDVRAQAGLAGVDISAGAGTTNTDNSSVATTTSVVNNISVNVSNSEATAADIVAEIQRQLELAGVASQ